MNKTISTKDTVIIGLMLFALFFGAGNLVFPVMLGQSAGTEVWLANLGFLLTGVGLPLLGVIAFSFSGKPDLLSLTQRVHPLFALVFTTTLYLTIGPLFAMPRTGSVSYEIGIKPYISDQSSAAALLIFTVLFFGLTCFLSLNPSKMIDIVGKLLTPLLIAFIAILSAVALLYPLGMPQAAQGEYVTDALFIGFQEGYLTMDALAAFVFGIIVINAIKDKGAHSKKHLLLTGVKSALLAAAVLAVIYSALAYIGAASVEQFGYLSNGGEALALISQHYFGVYGGVFLGIIVLLACLTTSIGLTTACSSYLHKLMPRVSYKSYAVLLSIVSALLANVGLNELIQISVPVLTTIYPLAIVLMFLTFVHPLFKGKKQVYWFSLSLTFLVSLIEGLSASRLKIASIHELYIDILPLYDVGLGWIIPAAIGAMLGLIWPSTKRPTQI
ncbi:branched-chain amino acid transport system carrier protein [Paenibacillus montaniterrae]|uniref:Branched-chain amino acid transport system carrier protein n=1 Tax=Paenibacillus montaniterrae TaxID=429341 RepID=A0A919YTT5_9BACL|nr:branched-chain amino acid transport system II carrier protein [Paenibacillus montaniterrae]GIP19360.1 branched-chain amino acid transport system carrier protein [Paenibacillus montaniterrae]